jgi:hypothetical protein
MQKERIAAHILGFLFWFPALLAGYIDPGKLIATHRVPFPQDFLDSELGIPAEEEGFAPVKENPINYQTGNLIRPENFVPYMVKNKYGVTPFEA